MKSLLIFATLLLAFAVFVEAKPRHPLPPHMQAAQDACLKKFDVTLSEEESQESKESGEKKRDRSCFIACMFKEVGIINGEGDIVKEEALKDFPPHVPQENRTRLVDACIEQKGADDCETADLYHSCVKKLNPHPFVDPETMKRLEACREKLGLTEEEIHRRGGSYKYCLMSCLAKEKGIMNEDGTFNVEVFIEKLPVHLDKENARKVAEECGKKEGADECETTALRHRCFRKNNINFVKFHGQHHSGPHHNE